MNNNNSDKTIIFTSLKKTVIESFLINIIYSYQILIISEPLFAQHIIRKILFIFIRELLKILKDFISLNNFQILFTKMKSFILIDVNWSIP